MLLREGSSTQAFVQVQSTCRLLIHCCVEPVGGDYIIIFNIL